MSSTTPTDPLTPVSISATPKMSELATSISSLVTTPKLNTAVNGTSNGTANGTGITTKAQKETPKWGDISEESNSASEWKKTTDEGGEGEDGEEGEEEEELDDVNVNVAELENTTTESPTPTQNADGTTKEDATGTTKEESKHETKKGNLQSESKILESAFNSNKKYKVPVIQRAPGEDYALYYLRSGESENGQILDKAEIECQLATICTQMNFNAPTDILFLRSVFSTSPAINTSTFRQKKLTPNFMSLLSTKFGDKLCTFASHADWSYMDENKKRIKSALFSCTPFLLDETKHYVPVDNNGDPKHNPFVLYLSAFPNDTLIPQEKVEWLLLRRLGTFEKLIKKKINPRTRKPVPGDPWVIRILPPKNRASTTAFIDFNPQVVENIVETVVKIRQLLFDSSWENHVNVEKCARMTCNFGKLHDVNNHDFTKDSSNGDSSTTTTATASPSVSLGTNPIISNKSIGHSVHNPHVKASGSHLPSNAVRVPTYTHMQQGNINNTNNNQIPASVVMGSLTPKPNISVSLQPQQKQTSSNSVQPADNNTKKPLYSSLVASDSKDTASTLHSVNGNVGTNETPNKKEIKSISYPSANASAVSTSHVSTNQQSSIASYQHPPQQFYHPHHPHQQQPLTHQQQHHQHQHQQQQQQVLQQQSQGANNNGEYYEDGSSYGMYATNNPNSIIDPTQLQFFWNHGNNMYRVNFTLLTPSGAFGAAPGAYHALPNVNNPNNNSGGSVVHGAPHHLYAGPSEFTSYMNHGYGSPYGFQQQQIQQPVSYPSQNQQQPQQQPLSQSQHTQQQPSDAAYLQSFPMMAPKPETATTTVPTATA
jgi:hypothetical protein